MKGMKVIGDIDEFEFHKDLCLWEPKWKNYNLNSEKIKLTFKGINKRCINWDTFVHLKEDWKEEIKVNFTWFDCKI
jgi:hypothetical protein